MSINRYLSYLLACGSQVFAVANVGNGVCRTRWRAEALLLHAAGQEECSGVHRQGQRMRCPLLFPWRPSVPRLSAAKCVRKEDVDRRSRARSAHWDLNVISRYLTIANKSS